MKNSVPEPAPFPEWGAGSPLNYLKQLYRFGDTGEIKKHQLLLAELEDSIADNLADAAELFDVRNWDLQKLKARDNRIAKPRINLVINITSKENFVLRWYPQGEFSPGLHRPEMNETDFHSHVNHRLDQLLPHERPINEVMFIHEVWRLEAFNNRPLSYVKQCLLFTLAATVYLWRERLWNSFEVSMPKKIGFTTEGRRVTNWSIQDAEGLPKKS